MVCLGRSHSAITNQQYHLTMLSMTVEILPTFIIIVGFLMACQVGNEGEIQPVMGRTLPPSQYSLALEQNLGPHDPSGLIKCCESLAFLVRDVAHITPYNFDDCVHCIRTFVEASLHGSKYYATMCDLR